MTVWVTKAKSAGARPSARALSWSRSTPQRANRVVPVELDVAHLRTRSDHRFDLTCDRTNHLRIRTDDTELDREADRRAELEARHTDPDLREFLVDARHQAGAHAFTRLHVARHDDEDGVARVRQLRIERQIEARLAGARIRGEEANVLVLLQHRLHLLHLLGRRGERSAFLQSQLDDELGPRAVGEELLRHEPASDNRDGQRGDGGADDPPPPLDGKVDRAA